MLSDLTTLDSLGWEALKLALNQRVVIDTVKLVPSKRNRVWIVETDVRPVVVKRFLSGKCEREFESLLQAKQAGLEVPIPLAKSGDYLVTEFISGDGCEELINHMFSSEAAQGMGSWLARFHRGLRMEGSTRLMNDAVLSNFILSEGATYGVDLEDVDVGDARDDIGKLAASILGTEPFFTPIKFDLCLRMIESYESASETKIMESIRPFISRHLRLDARSRPLFRRTLVAAADSLERRWPELA